MYGADMKDVELTSQYVIEHYTVKNLVVSVYIHNAETYDTEANPLTYNLHYKVDGSSPLLFYAKYLLADPRIGLEKLQRSRTDPYLQQSYRVFDPETGAYDKSSRDVEPIGDLSAYLARAEYAAFTDYPTASTSRPSTFSTALFTYCCRMAEREDTYTTRQTLRGSAMPLMA